MVMIADKRMNVGYLRVSTEEQLKGYSIANQEQTVLRSAEIQDITIDKFYIDEGKSAFKKHVYRKDFEQLILDVKADRIARIFIWKLDRLIRNNIKNEELFLLFEKHGVQIISVTEWHLDFSTADGRANIQKKGVDNQYESERTSERVKASAYTSAKMGNYPKGRVPLGYKRIHNEYPSAPLVEDEIAGVQVKFIFEKMFKEKIGSWALLNWLNSNSNMNRVWKEEFLYSLLHNKIYIGTYEDNMKKPTYSIDNHKPPLISDEIFTGVQKIIKSRMRSRKYKYHFARYIKCTCGCMMSAKSAKNGQKQPYLYYFCKKCRARVSQEKLDKEIIPIMNAKIFEDKNLKLFKKGGLIFKKLKSIEYLISENENLLVEGIIEKEYYMSRSRDFLKKE